MSPDLLPVELPVELPPYLSVTQITTYLTCPRMYWFKYVERRAPERRGASLALGSAVHSAIDWYLSERRDGRSPDIPAVQKLFYVDWFAQLATNEYDLEDKTPEEYRALGEALVALFVERFASEPPMGSEERFEVFLTDPVTGEPLPVPLVGYFDLVREDGIGEIKTTARKSAPSQWELQLSAYAYAWRQTRGTTARVQVIQLVKTKEPKLLVDEADLRERDEAFFCEVAVAAYRSILAGCFHPAPSSTSCGRCDYWKACRRAA